jgi:hypothetical protein
LACDGPSIGPIQFLGARGSRIESDIFGFQCVELVDRYLYALKGWHVEQVDGADIARVYGATQHVAPIRNGNRGGRRPHPGDVVSFSVFPDFTDHEHNFPGHVAIVIAASAHSLTLLNENWNGGAAITSLPISGTTIQSILTDSKHHGLVTTRYIEWLPIRLKPPSSGYGPFYVLRSSSRGLAVHQTPSASSHVTRHLSTGTATYIACQTIAKRYVTVASATDDVWDELRGGGYVANFWLSAPNPVTLSPGIARC